MQQAIPYRTWPNPGSPIGLSFSSFESRKSSTSNSSSSSSSSTTTTTTISNNGLGRSSEVKEMVAENAVLVFGRRGCCMMHVMKRLLLGLGVNPAIFEVEEDEEEVAVAEELAALGGGAAASGGGGKEGRPQFPVVYIGGRLFGGLDRLMGAHITGELIPLLKQAGGLWL